MRGIQFATVLQKRRQVKKLSEDHIAVVAGRKDCGRGRQHGGCLDVIQAFPLIVQNVLRRVVLNAGYMIIDYVGDGAVSVSLNLNGAAQVSLGVQVNQAYPLSRGS